MKKSGERAIAPIYGLGPPDRKGRTPKKDSVPIGTPTKRYRGIYFKIFRKERDILNRVWKYPYFPEQHDLISESDCGSKECRGDHCANAEYRLARHVYYRILPRLFRFMFYGPDYYRVHELEEYLFNAIAVRRFLKGKPTPKRLRNRFLWKERDSIEPPRA